MLIRFVNENGEQFNVAPQSDSVVKYVRVYPQGVKGRSLDYRAKDDFETFLPSPK